MRVLFFTCTLLLSLQSILGFLIPPAPSPRPRISSSFPLRSSMAPGDEAAERSAAVEKIKSLVGNNKVMLFMKGSKLFPQCGFSNTAVSILRACDAEFETFDVLSDYLVREEIKNYSSWPTIPQCYVNGEFVGGSDILLEMFESGELEKTLAELKK